MVSPGGTIVYIKPYISGSFGLDQLFQKAGARQTGLNPTRLTQKGAGEIFTRSLFRALDPPPQRTTSAAHFAQQLVLRRALSHRTAAPPPSSLLTSQHDLRSSLCTAAPPPSSPLTSHRSSSSLELSHVAPVWKEVASSPLHRREADRSAMAMRSGSGHGASMIVTNTPSPDLALTNLAYCSAHDVRKYAIHAAGSALALVGDTVLMIPYVKVILL
ncbi:Vesicle-fusing ATPase [Nymphaea thermarum]|nr:Vesicle-fusing ATPase [Nymphaea thermarum]